MKGMIYMKKIISGILALAMAISGSAVMASAASWQNVNQQTSGTTDVTLRWTPDASADGYRIYKWDQANKKYQGVKTVGGKWKSAVKLTGLTSGTSYRFVVKSYAYDKAGLGSNKIYWTPKSDAIVVSTAPGSTNITSSTRAVSNAVRVFWTKYNFKNMVDGESNSKFGGIAVKWYNQNTLRYQDVAYVSGGRTNVRLNGCLANKKYTFKVAPYTINWVKGSSVKVMGTDSNAYTIKTSSR
ncbi:MAG: fibronectin type III domain-containing protein [Ruminococcus sp.]|nr:fibronectin type III domain-containing protein [Ruminococcus sp.]